MISSTSILSSATTRTDEHFMGGEIATLQRCDILKEEGFCFTSLVSNTCVDYPIACWKNGRFPFFTCIDESLNKTNHWDDLLYRHYSMNTKLEHVDETQDELKLSTVKRKRRVKEPTLSPTHEEELDETEEQVDQLNEEDSFSGRNFKKTKLELHACMDEKINHHHSEKKVETSSLSNLQ